MIVFSLPSYPHVATYVFCGAKVCHSLFFSVFGTMVFRALWKADRIINAYTKLDDADNGKQPVLLTWKVHRYNKILLVLRWVFPI